MIVSPNKANTLSADFVGFVVAVLTLVVVGGVGVVTVTGGSPGLGWKV
ncbi:hypothetical protein BASH2_02205 [Bacillus anthracis]|nr:hypothetical protein BASH2_02205 [Bacillus anthracis]